ncbi:protein transport protein Sec16A-like isoform X4 [Hoplias malabaricus]|uniref:protein transport protein Sec16A-like isoform X4 n=1 Tax=Hoplias malabaricus TaxID=27720 RepID=UPI003461D84A
MNLRGHWPQMGSEAQFYDQKYQKEEHKQKQHEQCTSEHSHNSQLRQMRCRDRSMSTDRNKTSTYWSENYTDYYNYGGWNPQGQYSNAYYQDYYYPCTYGYQTDFSKSNSQQYNTKPYNYEDWWRYDPRYDSSFDYDQFTQCQLSPCDQNDTESSHSGYSTQSMSSTNSQSSHFSWHSEQGWGYPIQQYTDYPHYDGNIQSPAHFVDHAHLEKESGKITVACSLKGPSTSEQFPFLHCCARFGPGGQLSVVLPNLPSEGKPALVQIHSTEMMLQGCRDQPELQGFPGPLIKHKTHKSEVLEFIRKKRQECLHNETLVEKQASCLIWKLMELICKHNGKLVGTDISHLLLRNSDSSSKISTSDLIDFSNEALSRTVENKTCDAESASQDDVWAISNDTEKDLQCFRELLIFGKKKDALETAISKGLWGHAFMLAGKMDSRACSNVMSKFIDSLAVNDSLRTFYQLMSGKMPSSATCCEIKDCGHWHIHLAMVLSNHTHFKHLHQKTITRMGDTLASQGCSVAASFCYMVVQLGTDTQSNKTDTCLFGVNSSFNSSLPALKYATNEAIQRTEIFEYALSLGFDSVHLYNFQIFKFIYACRLAEAGLYIQALQYCEVISKALLASGSGHSLTLISQIIELSTKMRYVDQQFKDIPEIELSSEPEWLISIRKLHCHILEELNTHGSKTQDTNLPMLETNSQGTPPTIRTLPSYQISLLTTEKPDQENYTPDVHLVPPASQDILEYRDKPMIPKSSQILDPTCFQLSKKAVPLSVSPIYQMSSHQENLNGSPVEESIQDKPPAVLEPQIQILLTDVMQPEGLVHTDDSNDLPNDDSSETNASTNTLVRSQPSPSTLEPTAGDLQSQSLSIVPKSTQHTLDPHTLPSAMLSCSKSVATESEILPQITAPNIEPTTLASTMSVATECEPLPWLISPYKESQTVPSTTLPSISLETEIKCVHPTISPTTETNMVASTLSSSMSLVQDSVCIPPSCGPCTDLNSLSSTVLPSSKSLPAKSESIPQLIVPLPVTPSFDHMGKRCQKHHPVTQPSVAVAPLQMVSDNNQCYYSTKQNLSSPEVQQVHPKTTPRLCPAFEPQSLHSAVSNGKSQRTDTVDSQAVPLLTVPLPASHILPPISKDYSAIQGQHAAETEIRPAQMSCLLVDSALGQTPPRLFSANPYSMGEKMAHSKQTHTLSKPLIPRLFVPQSLHPDPKDQKQEAGGGWLSWLFGKKKEVCFPVDTGKSLVWDENLQRWVDPSEEKKKRKHELVHSKRVNRMTTEKLGELAEPHTKGLSSGMPILTSGPKRGYMATLNPVLMSNNTDTHFYTSSSISSCEPPMVKPANTYQTDRAISGHSIKQVSEHMGWKQSAPSMPYSPTSDDILEEIM